MTLSVPHNFEPGTKASAIQVNQNFDAVESYVNGLETTVNNISTNVANKNGDPTQTFEVDDPITDTDAVNKRYFIDRITTELNNKADKDLDNIVIDNSFADKLNAVGIRTVKETWSSGSSWYRKWSDGWCEQGGHQAPASSGVITFVVPFINTSYTITIGSSRTRTDFYYNDAYNIKYNNGFAYVSNVGNGYQGFDWVAYGYTE